MSDITSTVNWNLDWVMNEDIITMLFAEPVKQSVLFAGNAIEVERGNIYKILCEGQEMYVGMQTSDSERGFEGGSTFKAELTSLGKHLLSCFSLKQAIDSTNFDYYQYDEIYEQFQYLSGIPPTSAITNIASIGKRAGTFHFVPLSEFRTAINEWLNACYASIMRETYNVVFELPTARYYRSLENYPQYIDTEIMSSDLLLLAYVKLEGKAIGGLLSQSEDAMGGQYETLFDLLGDWSASEGMLYQYSVDGKSFYPSLLLGYEPSSIECNKIDLKKVTKSSTKQTTVSLLEFTPNDIDNYRYNESVARNQKELQIALLFNTTPPANDYKEKSTDTKKRLTASGPARVWNYYYSTNVQGIAEPIVLRPHTHIKQMVEVRSGTITLGIETDEESLDLTVDGAYTAQKHCLAIQREKSKADLFKDLNAKVFSSHYLAEGWFYTGNIQSHSIVDILNNKDLMIPIAVDDFSAFARNYPSEWFMTAIKFDFETEIVEFTAFARSNI